MLFPASIRNLVKHTSGALTDAGLPALTGREGEVLRLMATGLQNAEIAAELSISLETVKTHVVRILGKLGVRDRTQAVIRAYRTGVRTPSPEPRPSLVTGMPAAGGRARLTP